MAASMDVHACLHDDASDSHHHCLANDLELGILRIDPITPITLAQPPELTIAFAPAFHDFYPSSLPLHLHGSLLTHGPPA